MSLDRPIGSVACMKTISWHLDTGMNGCDLEGEVEVDDDASIEDIEREVREDMWDRLSLTWAERT